MDRHRRHGPLNVDGDLQTFARGLREIMTEKSRPFVCDGSPLDCEIFLVGANPATDMDKPFWAFWDATSGFRKSEWFEEYKAERLRRPLKPGKTRRNAVSNTRARLDWIVQGAAPVRCFETNVYAEPAEVLPDLPAEARGTQVFEYLLQTIRPRVLFLHGKDAQDYFSALIRQRLIEGDESRISLNGRETVVLPMPHLSRGWSAAKARSVGAHLRALCR